ncbi:MAG: ribosome assembly cofactor RimP [Oscillospiraceae bacterium]|jgi:ribosome maturation factor RimP|nr:ribosome assembly cofactor RimP [Oscillospiraceae bacterium]
MSNRTEDQARRAVLPFLQENDCVLWDVVFEKEGAMHYLKILFDDKDGSLDDEKCVKLTPPLNKLLDSHEFIKQVDIVEIGSPGLTRRLRHPEHFESCMNRRIRILRMTDSGKSEIKTGILSGYSAENKSVTLDVDGELNEVLLKKCIRITLEEQPQ